MNLGYNTALTGLTGAFSSAATGIDPSLHNRNQTLLQKITPNVTRHAPSFNAADHMAGGPNADFQTLRGQVAGVKEQAQQIQGGITADIRQAQGALMQSVAEVAKMQNIPVANAMKAVFPDQSSANLNAMATVAIDLSTMGGGTAVTIMMQGTSVVSDLISAAKTGGVDKKGLLDQALDHMRSAQHADPVSQASQTAQNVVPTNKFDWSGVSLQDLELLASVDAEKPGEAIPEWDAAQNVVIAVEKVDEHNQEIEAKLDENVKHYDVMVTDLHPDYLMEMVDLDVAGAIETPVEETFEPDTGAAAAVDASLDSGAEMTITIKQGPAMRSSYTNSY